MAGILIVLLRYLPFVALTTFTPAYAQSPTVIPSRVIKVVEFTDAGNVYRVDLDSGAVTRTKSGDVVPVPPAPEPPKPEPPAPPKPEPPKLDSVALIVHDQFRSKVGTNFVETAAALAQAIDVTLAVSGGLGYRGKQIFDEMEKQIDYANLRPRLKGFPLGDILNEAINGDPNKIVPVLREVMIGLRAVR